MSEPKLKMDGLYIIEMANPLDSTDCLVTVARYLGPNARLEDAWGLNIKDTRHTLMQGEVDPEELVLVPTGEDLSVLGGRIVGTCAMNWTEETYKHLNKES